MNCISLSYNVLDDQELSINNSIQGRQPIRSFVRREGRITPAQQRALAQYWSTFGVNANSGRLDLNSLFGRDAPRILEIGFGNGESLVTMATACPDFDYLGIEIHRPGIGHLLLRAAALSLTNVRVLCGDAIEVLEQQIPDASLDRLQIFFPDPWPKTRHHKRRLIQAERIPLFLSKLKQGGQWHIATDCDEYAHTMLKLLNKVPGLVNGAPEGGFIPRPGWRPVTRFEQRGCALGHPIRDLLFIRRDTE